MSLDQPKERDVFKAPRGALRQPEKSEDLVCLYLDDISRYPLLTKDDEVCLSRRIEAGMEPRAELEAGAGRVSRRRRLEETARDGEVATQEFVNANLRLVVSIAKKYRAYGVVRDDDLVASEEGIRRGVAHAHVRVPPRHHQGVDAELAEQRVPSSTLGRLGERSDSGAGVP
jgi:sigma-70-like protein